MDEKKAREALSFLVMLTTMHLNRNLYELDEKVEVKGISMSLLEANSLLNQAIELAYKEVK